MAKKKPKKTVIKKKHVKKLKKLPISVLILALILIVGALVVFYFYGDKVMSYLTPEKKPIVYSSEQNEQGYYFYSLEAPGGYYETANNKIGNELFLELRTIIQKDFNKVSYGDARYILSYSDRDPNDETKVIGIYDNDIIANYWIGKGDGAWQREHVWPNSKLGDYTSKNITNSYKGIASDLHNLRAITGINQTRSNRYFEEGSGKATTIGTEAFYPGDDHKGDVARILFYMITMYPDLELTNIIDNLTNNPDTNYTLERAFMGKKDLLLKWHKEDPVSEFERNRNNFIFEGIAKDQNGKEISPQGNRNPFIDHPEYVHLIWEEKTINELTKEITTTTYVIMFYYKKENFYLVS
ncbi:MAG: hypothetical protein GX931_00270 [Acholeplasmataceae bacterium]|nr:hypothetical protein [Acholeplasmataceae bacterium]